MSTQHGFSDRELITWPAPAQAAALWERAAHATQRAEYWQRRAEHSERELRDLRATSERAKREDNQ